MDQDEDVTKGRRVPSDEQQLVREIPFEMRKKREKKEFDKCLSLQNNAQQKCDSEMIWSFQLEIQMLLKSKME